LSSGLHNLGLMIANEIWENEIWEKSKTHECQICKHLVAQIAHQINRQLRNSGILHDSSISKDERVPNATTTLFLQE